VTLEERPIYLAERFILGGRHKLRLYWPGGFLAETSGFIVYPGERTLLYKHAVRCALGYSFHHSYIKASEGRTLDIADRTARFVVAIASSRDSYRVRGEHQLLSLISN
jgi:hypothetical protein